MKAAYIETTGGPETILIGDLPEPTCGDHQVVIRVYAVSVNPIDTYIRAGAINFEQQMPYIIGCDASGVVEVVGNQVSGISVGDRVWCTNQGMLGKQGTFAERIAVDAAWCYPLPENVSYDDAAASALVGVTAHLGLVRTVNLQPDESILVIGGTGGVGSMVVQMAKNLGARVITTAGSQPKCEQAKSLGADVVVNYKTESIEQAVAEHFPGGVNVLWETRREPDFDAAVEMLSPRGRMVLMAGRDARPAFPVGPFYVKECSLHGLVMFKGTPAELRAAANDINRWMANDKLKANIAQKFSLDEAVRAHQLQEASTLENDGSLCGKIVLRI